MYKNLAAMFVAACCTLPAFSTFSQTRTPATPLPTLGFVPEAPRFDAGRTLSDGLVLALNILAQGVQGKLDR